jgi:hypothetical protein
VSKKLVHGGNPGWKSEYYGNHLAAEEEGYTLFRVGGLAHGHRVKNILGECEIASP